MPLMRHLTKMRLKRRQKSLQTRSLMRLALMWLLGCHQLLKVISTNKNVDNSQARNAVAPARNVAPPESSAEVDDLERRLASLRRL
uniref:Uncharacterized protein n=1 Tax=Arundo donax TaxID=35708 RepID=A0A0A9FPD5_ARUDO